MRCAMLALVISALFMLAGCGEASRPASTATPTGFSFADIKQAYATTTTAQWPAFVATLRGKAINNWHGKIVDVLHIGSDPNVINMVYIDFDNDGLFDSAFPGLNSSAALALSKGQGVTVTAGWIRDVSTYSGPLPGAELQIGLSDNSNILWR